MNIKIKESKLAIIIVLLLIALSAISLIGRKSPPYPYTFCIEEDSLYVFFDQKNRKIYLGKTLDDIERRTDCIEQVSCDRYTDHVIFAKKKHCDSILFINESDKYQLIRSNHFDICILDTWKKIILVDSIRGYHRVINPWTRLEEDESNFSSYVYNWRGWQNWNVPNAIYYRRNYMDEPTLIPELK